MLWRLFQTGVVCAEPDGEEADAGDVFLLMLLCEDLGGWIQLDDQRPRIPRAGAWDMRVLVPQGK